MSERESVKEVSDGMLKGCVDAEKVRRDGKGAGRPASNFELHERIASKRLIGCAQEHKRGMRREEAPRKGASTTWAAHTLPRFRDNLST